MRHTPLATSFAGSMPFAPCVRERSVVRTGPDPSGRASCPVWTCRGRGGGGHRVPCPGLIHDPHRVGKQLRGDLAGIHSARRGTYRILVPNQRGPARSGGPPHRPQTRRLPTRMSCPVSTPGRVCQCLHGETVGGVCQHLPTPRPLSSWEWPRSVAAVLVRRESPTAR